MNAGGGNVLHTCAHPFVGCYHRLSGASCLATKAKRKETHSPTSRPSKYASPSRTAQSTHPRARKKPPSTIQARLPQRRNHPPPRRRGRPPTPTDQPSSQSHQKRPLRNRGSHRISRHPAKGYGPSQRLLPAQFEDAYGDH